MRHALAGLGWLLLACGEADPVPVTPGTGTATPGPDVGACAVEPGRMRLDGERYLGEASVEWQGTVDAPIGYALGSPGDVNGDGFDDVLIGSTTEDTMGDAAGALWLFHGPFGGRVDVAEADARFLGVAEGDNAGWLVAPVGDVNGDGVDDVLGQTHRHADHAGLVFLAFGPVSGDHLVTGTDVVIVGDAPDRGLGMGLAGLGDVNGDGRADVAVGAFLAGNGTTWIWHQGLVAGQWSESAADAGFTGETEDGDQAGVVLVGPGDLTGDGLGDLFIGDFGHADARGRVYEVHAPFTGIAPLEQAAASVSGGLPGGYLGVRMTAGDLDGDCMPDAVIQEYGSGTVLVFGGGLSRAAAGAEADGRIDLGNDVDGSLAVPGDLDGDGFDELVVGDPSGGGAGSPGSAWLFYGPLVGHRRTEDAEVRFRGAQDGERVGTGAAGAGDTDGDGFPELLVGAGGANELRGVVALYPSPF